MTRVYAEEELKTTKIYHGKGCSICNKGGYKGRTGLYEVMEINDELRELILVGASALELKKKAVEQGMMTLRRSGLVKMAAGHDHDGRSAARNSFVRDRERVNDGWNYTKRIAEKDDRDGRERPAHHDQQRAARARARQACGRWTCRR